MSKAEQAQKLEETGKETSEARAANQALVDVLTAQGIRGSVFFNCARLREGDGTVEVWADAGMDVDTSYAHYQLDIGKSAGDYGDFTFSISTAANTDTPTSRIRDQASIPMARVWKSACIGGR